MKKARLSTKQEKALLTDIVLNMGVAYIKRFTNKELNKFKNKPVVIPVGNYRFFIGPYEVKGIHKDCWEVTRDGQYIHNFLSKLNAMLYCIGCTRDQYQQSCEIKKWDSRLGNLTTDLVYYARHIKIEQGRGDIDKKEMFTNRYIDAKLQQEHAIINLQKTINSAKYNNFRNMNNETI
jgi:hypothetical protein